MLFSLPFEARQLEALALATAIGLLMGLERERRPAARAGVRTFGLTGLLGALAALLAELLATPAFIAMGFAVVAVMIIAAFIRHPELAERLRRDFRRLSSPQRSYHLSLRRGLMVWTDERPDGRRRVQHKEPDASWQRRLLAQLVRWLPVESQL